MEVITEKYRRRCRKYGKAVEQQDEKADQLDQLTKRNAVLEEQVKRLRDDVHCMKLGSHSLNRVGNFSPQWVAHTNNKGRPEQLLKVEEVLEESPISDQQLKKSLADTIATLQQSNTHFTGSCLQGAGVADTSMELVQKLLEAYSDSILRHFGLLMRESNRKIDNYQRKLNNLTNKWENLLMDVHNNRLRSSIRKSHTIQSGRKTLHELTLRN